MLVRRGFRGSYYGEVRVESFRYHLPAAVRLLLPSHQVLCHGRSPPYRQIREASAGKPGSIRGNVKKKTLLPIRSERICSTSSPLWDLQTVDASFDGLPATELLLRCTSPRRSACSNFGRRERA